MSPRSRLLSISAVVILAAGLVPLARWSRSPQGPHPDRRENYRRYLAGYERLREELLTPACELRAQATHLIERGEPGADELLLRVAQLEKEFRRRHRDLRLAHGLPAEESPGEWARSLRGEPP
jgi:hypothetical protein